MKPSTHSRAAGALVVVALLTAACGSNGSASGSSSRSFAVEMKDTAYTPDRVTVARGEEVRFSFVNHGKVRHEAYVGSPAEQAEHEKQMGMAAGSGGGHDGHGAMAGGDAAKVTVKPGKRGEITYRFAQPGTYEVGCHEPGHYVAGMKLTVDVT
jgi:uncharacterized cupredoxin-like copper-binding protein